jgi:hypothetical protein
MKSFPSLLCALALAAPAVLLPMTARSSDRALPMRFDLRQSDGTSGCGRPCRAFIEANGAITADTPRDFENFAKNRDLRGMTMALDSDGGSVLGAITLGRAIRRLDINTTVARAVDLDKGNNRTPFAALSPHADCQSMCAFVLLGGVHRTVPPEARVMVHQIWLGDRRDDPTAANYSAEDLVLVQRDIGRLAQYTVEMGASIDLLDLSLRIPPWEPMHMLTADEISRMHVATDLPSERAPATVAASPLPGVSAAAPLIPPGSMVKPTAISEQRWAMIDRAGTFALARRHPLTVEGEDIGSFDLSVSCGGPDSYDVIYAERRHAGDQHPLPAALTAITLAAGSKSASLKVSSSQFSRQTDELTTFASATVPASMIASFAAVGNHSLTITTRSAVGSTGIRLGNTGAMQNLPRLAAGCVKPIGDHADLSAIKIGGLAVAK